MEYDYSIAIKEIAELKQANVGLKMRLDEAVKGGVGLKAENERLKGEADLKFDAWKRWYKEHRTTEVLELLNRIGCNECNKSHCIMEKPCVGGCAIDAKIKEMEA